MTEQKNNSFNTGIPNDSNFRPLGNRRVIVSKAFAEDVYNACFGKPSRPIILVSLSRAGFDTDALGFCLDETLYASFVNHGCPTEDRILVWRNISPRDHAEVAPELRKAHMSLDELVQTGLFRYVGAGISLAPNFEQELFQKYPRQSIEEGLRLAGVDPDDLGASRILRLKKRFDSKLRNGRTSIEVDDPGIVPMDPTGVSGEISLEQEADKVEASGEEPVISAQLSDDDLIATGKFEKVTSGVAFSAAFENELYSKYPERSIEEGLRDAGLSVESVGSRRVNRLKTKFKILDGRNPSLFLGMPQKNQWRYTPETVDRYLSHPYVRECTEFGIVLTEEFYDQAAFMTSLSIEEVLSSFSIEPGLFSFGQRNELYQLLEERPLTPMKEPGFDQMSGYPEVMVEILYNRMNALCRSLEMELDGIAHDLPNMMPAKKRELFRFLASGLKDPGGKYNVSFFIKALGVARSTFYCLARDEADGPVKLSREERDAADAAAIRRVFEYKGFAKGARQIYMMLPDLEGIHMGLGKIHRLMDKFDMHCTVRDLNPSKQRGKIIQSHVKENLIKRQFRLYRPNEVRLTDVTYLIVNGNERAYGSAFLDPVTSKVISFNLSQKNDLDLVKETLRLSKENPAVQGGIVHSDQGVLYLSLEYQAEIEQMGLAQSMSKRGNCLDNAPMESFWGHFKDEVDLKDLTFEKACATLNEYVKYYNTERRLWGKDHMTPVEYEEYLSAMTPEEFDKYLTRERARYEEMKKSAAEKAINRAKTLGVDGVSVEDKG